MRKIIIVLQLVILLAFTYILCFTAISRVTAGIPFTALLLLLIIAGVYVSNAGEKRLKSRIMELLKELNVASSRIGSVSQEIGITIGESNESTRALFNEAREMSSLTSDVNENLSDMIAQLKGMITFSDEARFTAQSMERTSRDSLLSIKSGMAEIMRIVDTMKEIKYTSSKASDSIGTLRVASRDVRTIIDTIGDISKQMHIIAINASVEAQRAGAHGSSFGVVAKEFQSLSNMTDNSMRKIGALIDGIQKDIIDVYNVVMENSGRVDEGVRYTQVVEDSLKSIESSFSEVNKLVGRISGIAEEEARLTADMGARIDHVESLIDETNINVRRVYESALEHKRGIENIADMGTKLNAASIELLTITGSSAGETTEKLDDKTRHKCASFFPVIEKELSRNADILSNDRALHFDILNLFKTKHQIIEAVWTNETNGRFICSIPKAGIANAAMRDWFRAAVSGESYISSIYISGITKNRCVTLSMPYYDDSGRMSGIVGADLALDMLQG